MLFNHLVFGPTLFFLVINAAFPTRTEKFFFSDLKYFVSSLISGQKFFLKCLNKAWIFYKYFISYPNSDQKLAKSRLFLARKSLLVGLEPAPFWFLYT